MKPFFKQVLASLIGTVTGMILLVTLGSASLIILLLMAGSQKQDAQIKDNSVLVLDLSKPISDISTPPSLSDLLSNQNSENQTLHGVVQSINKASNDPAIKAIFLDGSQGNYSNGYATTKEIRSALEKFKSKGKKIVAYGVSFSEKEYYLSSVAQEIYLNPSGSMELNGISSQPLFLTGALEKYGVGVQVVRVGKYKSAVEPLIRKNLSPENKQQLQVLLNDFWQQFLNTVGTARNIKQEKLQEIADNLGYLNPEAAQQAGLIDKASYYDEVIEKLKKITGPSKDQKQSFEQVNVAEYLTKNPVNTVSQRKIAVVYAQGEIVEGQGNSGQVGGDRFAEEIRKLRKNEKVKAIVLRVNSPGGSAIASDLIWRELKLAQKVKPVVISMGDIAASGGYLIATAGERIFAEENTLTGSIGVFGVLFNLEKIAENNGITSEVVKTANLADINNNFRPKTERELKIYQKSVDEFYRTFLNKVVEGRKLPQQKVEEIAQGRVWSGKQAKEIGLVDEFGGLNAAIDYAAKKANLGNDWQLEEVPLEPSFDEILRKALGVQGKELDPLSAEFIKLKKELFVIQSFNDPKKIYTRLPFNLTIE